MENNIISAQGLKDLIKEENLIILDASPTSNASSIQVRHPGIKIPSARKLDIKKEFTDTLSSFPNTVPKPDEFQAAARKLGINRDSKLVVYDKLGIYSSPRIWWLFKTMGHDDVVVLNGGLNAWVDQDFETVSCHHDISQAEWKTGNFVAKLLEDYIFSYKQIKQNIIEDNFTVLDARSKKRFEGTAPEPRAHLKSGHISGSLCIPYQSVLIDGKFKSEKELKLIFEQANAKAQQIVFSCGSGMTACIIMLAYELVYPKSRYLYDGSWTEWAELENLKI